MYEPLQTVQRVSRCLMALALTVLCAATVAMAAPAETGETSARMLVPVGHTVGIKMFSRGVLVVRPPENSTPAKACGLRSGDVILKCGGVSVVSTEQFQSLLQKNGEETTQLQVNRGGDSVTLSVEPARNEQGTYCIGAWIRDSMAGIGTMTYYDPAAETFGALGHGITDIDTALLMPFADGSILPSTVKAVKKGQAGSAGELRGEFNLQKTLGELYANTECGVFGTMAAADYPPVCGEALPVGRAVTGPAVIRSNVRGDQVEEYEVEICRVISGSTDGRNLMLKVKDPELIAATGGIVQGMSGSPIIQNGQIVGAVTHVLVNDPTRGYGIFIENMLEAAGNS